MIEIKTVIDICYQTTKIVLDIYNSQFEVNYKSDQSPVTDADLKASTYIKNRLEEICDYPIVCEEGEKVLFEERKNWNCFWLIDPVDGTKEFVTKNGEFTINIALIKNGQPVLGVVGVPCQNLIYYAKKGKGSYRWNFETNERVRLQCHPFSLNDDVIVVASRSHMNEETKKFIDQLKVKKLVSVGSSLKFMMLAENKAHVYPRFVGCYEWDTAAAEAILNEAGGFIEKEKNGERLQYNKEQYNSPYFVAYGNRL